MDIYLEDDKKRVVKVFTEIKDSLLAVCDESTDKGQVLEALEGSIKKIQRLGAYLKHLDGLNPDNISDTNKPGLDVIKNNIKRFCDEIDQSVKDTSWIEGADTYAENQRAAVNEMIKAISELGLQGAAKADAEQTLEMMQKITPPEGAADWVVREMRNEMLLTGIKSHLNSTLISVVEL